MTKEIKQCSVVIIGAGVTGTAVAYALATMSSIKDVVILEKESEPGTVNSSATNNSQTLHTGDIETNYSLAKALSVKEKAEVLYEYVLSKDDPTLATKCNKMVLGVGKKEVEELKSRFTALAPHYPHLKLLDAVDIALLEPSVMAERKIGEPVVALSSTDGVMINYQELSKQLLKDAKAKNEQLEVAFDTRVLSVHEDPDAFIVRTIDCTYCTRTVVFACGAYSLHFAHMLGYGKKFALLPVAGSYFVVKNALKGKVYRVQQPNLPFAAVHGDPEITDPSVTRFGPTTRVLPLMERHHYETMKDFAGLYRNNVLKGIHALLQIVVRKRLSWYVFKNMLYDIPGIGKYLFLREARSIIPSLTYGDIELRKGAGGIRPQLVDLLEKDIPMGDATIMGKRCIFNTTPSPGASMCLANGIEYAKMLEEMLARKSIRPLG